MGNIKPHFSNSLFPKDRADYLGGAEGSKMLCLKDLKDLLGFTREDKYELVIVVHRTLMEGWAISTKQAPGPIHSSLRDD